MRIRVAFAFALAMAAVLAGTGWFLYARLDSHLRTALNAELRVRAQDLLSLIQQPSSSLALEGSGGLVERGESYAELLNARGDVVSASSSLDNTPLLSPTEVRDALRRPLTADRDRHSGTSSSSRGRSRCCSPHSPATSSPASHSSRSSRCEVAPRPSRPPPAAADFRCRAPVTRSNGSARR
jgi:hypothetical protein